VHAAFILPTVARGTYSPAGVLEANAVRHAKNNPAMWYPDR
jgi:hypothetical protein